MNIAELEFYPDDSDAPTIDKVLETDRLQDQDGFYPPSKAFDGDCFTFYHSPDASGDA